MTIQSLKAREKGERLGVRRIGKIDAATAEQNPPAVPPATSVTQSRNSIDRPGIHC